jgi:hypothetical protein
MSVLRTPGHAIFCYFKTLQTAKRQNARISELTQAFQRYKPRQ